MLRARLLPGIVAALAISACAWYFFARSASSAGSRASDPATRDVPSEQERVAHAPNAKLTEAEWHHAGLAEPLRFAASASAPDQASERPKALDVGDLLKLNPLLVERIQAGLVDENQHLLVPCFEALAKDTTYRSQKEALNFDVILDLRIEEEIGGVQSVEFENVPEALSADVQGCFRDRFSELSFDGADIAFEGPIRYPMRLPAPREP